MASILLTTAMAAADDSPGATPTVTTLAPDRGVAGTRIAVGYAPLSLDYSQSATVAGVATRRFGSSFANLVSLDVAERLSHSLQLEVTGTGVVQTDGVMSWVTGGSYSEQRVDSTILDAGLGLRARLAAHRGPEVSTDLTLVVGYRFSRQAMRFEQPSGPGRARETTLSHGLAVGVDRDISWGWGRFGGGVKLIPTFSTADTEQGHFSGFGLASNFEGHFGFPFLRGWVLASVAWDQRLQFGSSKWSGSDSSMVPAMLSYLYER